MWWFSRWDLNLASVVDMEGLASMVVPVSLLGVVGVGCLYYLRLGCFGYVCFAVCLSQNLHILHLCANKTDIDIYSPLCAN